jgi:hypothetical protein
MDFRPTKQTQAHDQFFHKLLDRDRLDDIFMKIGADVKCLTSDTQLAPSFNHTATGVLPLPRSLKSVLGLLQKAAPW